MVLLRQFGNKRKQSKTWNIIHEEGREIIQQWRDKRLRKQKISNRWYNQFLLCSFSIDTVKSFFQNINFLVLFQMLLAVISVFIFKSFDVSLDIPLTLFVSPIIFPLAFSINTDFQRREKVLEDLALFKSSGVMWYFCMREWQQASKLDSKWMTAVRGKLKSLLFHLQEYLLACESENRKVVLRVIYEDISDANQLIEQLRGSQLPANTAIISKSIHLLYMMCQSFERIRVVREYRSPRSIRSFTKLFIMCLPILLSPYFVHLGEKGTCKWGSYYIAVLVAFVFSALQSVQDKLDDPFNRMNEDDINLDAIDEWTSGSLEHTMKRSFDIGRFGNSLRSNASYKNRSLKKEPAIVDNDELNRQRSETFPLSDIDMKKSEDSDYNIEEITTKSTKITTTNIHRDYFRSNNLNSSNFDQLVATPSGSERNGSSCSSKKKKKNEGVFDSNTTHTINKEKDNQGKKTLVSDITDCTTTHVASNRKKIRRQNKFSNNKDEAKRNSSLMYIPEEGTSSSNEQSDDLNAELEENINVVQDDINSDAHEIKNFHPKVSYKSKSAPNIHRNCSPSNIGNIDHIPRLMNYPNGPIAVMNTDRNNCHVITLNEYQNVTPLLHATTFVGSTTQNERAGGLFSSLKETLSLLNPFLSNDCFIRKERSDDMKDYLYYLNI